MIGWVNEWMGLALGMQRIREKISHTIWAVLLGAPISFMFTGLHRPCSGCDLDHSRSGHRYQHVFPLGEPVCRVQSLVARHTGFPQPSI